MTHDRDSVDDLLPRVLSEHERELRRGVEELVRTGTTRLDVPSGHVQATLRRHGLFQIGGLTTLAFRGGEQVMSSWSRTEDVEVKEDSDSLMKYLAIALTSVLFDDR